MQGIVQCEKLLLMSLKLTGQKESYFEMENGRKHPKSIAGNKVAHLTSTRKEPHESFTLVPPFCNHVQRPTESKICRVMIVPCIDYYLNP